MTAFKLIRSPPRKQRENTATWCDPKITQVMSIILSIAVILPKHCRSRSFFLIQPHSLPKCMEDKKSLDNVKKTPAALIIWRATLFTHRVLSCRLHQGHPKRWSVAEVFSLFQCLLKHKHTQHSNLQTYHATLRNTNTNVGLIKSDGCLCARHNFAKMLNA